MTKINRPQAWLAVVIGLLATSVIIIVHTNLFIVKPKNNKQNQTVVNQNHYKTYSDDQLNFSFQIPAWLIVKTDVATTSEQFVWLTVNKIAVEDLVQDEFWKKNLNQLALGKPVVLPGDLPIKDSLLTATAGAAPAVIYNQLALDNCKISLFERLLLLIDNHIVVITMNHNSQAIAKELEKYSTKAMASDCQNKKITNFNSDALTKDLLVGKITQVTAPVMLAGIEAFKNILTSIEVKSNNSNFDREKFTTTTAFIIAPIVDKKNQLLLPIDEIMLLTGQDAYKQMKADGQCQNSCQVPLNGYPYNLTKKYKNQPIATNPVIEIKGSSKQTTQLSLSALSALLQQKPGQLFTVYFNKETRQIVGLREY